MKQTILLLASMLVLGCSSSAAPTKPLLSSSTEFVDPVTVEVLTEGRTDVAVQVEPSSSCRLTPANVSADHGVVLASSSAGIVRFQIQDAHDPLTLVCATSTGRTVAHPLIFAKVSSNPARIAEPPVGIARPPLAAEEIAGLSQEELRARHYPPRPDPAKSPGFYDMWLARVTQAVQVIDHPARVVLPHVNTVKQSSTWAGASISRGNYYNGATGTVVVPQSFDGFDSFSEQFNGDNISICDFNTSPSNPCNVGIHTDTALWVGINGVSAGDEDTGHSPIIQAGTHNQWNAYPVYNGPPGSPDPYLVSWTQVYATYAWDEYYPNFPENGLSDIPINQGDHVDVLVWDGDSVGDLGAGAYGWFVLTDNGVEVIDSSAPPSGVSTPFSVNAEWILETPTLSFFGGVASIGAGDIVYPQTKYSGAKILSPAGWNNSDISTFDFPDNNYTLGHGSISGGGSAIWLMCPNSNCGDSDYNTVAGVVNNTNGGVFPSNGEVDFNFIRF